MKKNPQFQLKVNLSILTARMSIKRIAFYERVVYVLNYHNCEDSLGV